MIQHLLSYTTAWGINRPLYLIYQQIWRLFPPASIVGKWVEP